MVTCPDCGTQYDQSAAHCPSCGRPNPLRQPGAPTGGANEVPRDATPGATGPHAGGSASGGAPAGGASAGGTGGGAYSAGGASTGGTGSGPYSGGGAPGQGGGFAGGASGAGGGTYGGGQAGGAAYGGARPEIPNYLVFAIFLTLCCCPPLAIPGLINAARVDARRDLGDIEGAWNASREAKKWCLIALGAGLVIWLISMIGYGGLVATAMRMAEQQGLSPEGM